MTTLILLWMSGAAAGSIQVGGFKDLDSCNRAGVAWRVEGGNTVRFPISRGSYCVEVPAPERKTKEDMADLSAISAAETDKQLCEEGKKAHDTFQMKMSCPAVEAREASIKQMNALIKQYGDALEAFRKIK